MDESHTLISQKSSILEVRMDSKYTLSIKLLLYRFGQLNKFWKKSKKKFRDIQQMTTHCPKEVFWRSSRERPGDVLNQPFRTSLESQIGTFPGRHFKMSPGQQIGTSPGRSNWIFREHPGNAGRWCPWDILETNICQLGQCYCQIWYIRHS